MNQPNFMEERKVKEPRAKRRRLHWIILIGLAAGGVTGAFLSIKLLLLVLFVACFILYSRLPDRLRWTFLNPMSLQDRSKHKSHDDDA
jgi:hypothetical protein